MSALDTLKAVQQRLAQSKGLQDIYAHTLKGNTELANGIIQGNAYHPNEAALDHSLVQGQDQQMENEQQQEPEMEMD